jgi:WD40 repeat protein
VFIFLVQVGVSCQWANDSQRLLLEHFEKIHNSPSQIYHYALPFSPSSSWLHNCYTRELSREVKVVKGFPDGWGMCSRTVTLAERLQALAYWKDTIAVGSLSGDIIILNAITGSQMAVLSGHTNGVASLAFSSDGTSLVSGSGDQTLKLWDVQTGGVVKTFHGHTNSVLSVSISLNYTTIASGSHDGTICLWDIWTGKCRCVIRPQGVVYWGGCYAVFSPTDPWRLISTSSSVIQEWDIDGHQVGLAYEGFNTGFSSNGTHFVSCWEGAATVQNSNSGVIVAKFPIPNTNPMSGSIHSCLSPNSTLVAVAAQTTIYIWDITGSDPLLIKTFIGHTKKISSLTFSSPSTLTSVSYDQSVKFWQIGGLSTDPVAGDPKSTPPTSVPIQSISLQAENGIAISSDSDGVVKVWDISTGLCKASYQTPAQGCYWRDARMIDGRLIFVWPGKKGIHIWDIYESKLLQIVGTDLYTFGSLRISGDGSKVFSLAGGSIHAWSMWTGEAMGKVEVRDTSYLGPLDGSKILVHCKYDTQTEVLDFGISGSHPIYIHNTSLERPRLHGISWWTNGPSKIEDSVTGKEVFWLSGRYAEPVEAQWDGQYLVAGYKSGEVLILDFNHLCLE